jgi:hypothetical protein
MREGSKIQVIWVFLVLGGMLLMLAGCNQLFAGGFYNGLAQPYGPYQPLRMHSYMIGDRFYSCQTMGTLTQCY